MAILHLAKNVHEKLREIAEHKGISMGRVVADLIGVVPDDRRTKYQFEDMLVGASVEYNATSTATFAGMAKAIDRHNERFPDRLYVAQYSTNGAIITRVK